MILRKNSTMFHWSFLLLATQQKPRLSDGFVTWRKLIRGKDNRVTWRILHRGGVEGMISYKVIHTNQLRSWKKHLKRIGLFSSSCFFGVMKSYTFAATLKIAKVLYEYSRQCYWILAIFNQLLSWSYGENAQLSCWIALPDEQSWVFVKDDHFR